MESLFFGAWLSQLVGSILVVGLVVILWCAFTSGIYNSESSRNVAAFCSWSIIYSILVVLFVYAYGQSGRGTVYVEKDLTVGKVYEVLYSSETKVEGGYLVVLEGRDKKDKKDERRPRVCLLPIKPTTSFYVTEVEGKIKYSDAAEVR